MKMVQTIFKRQNILSALKQKIFPSLIHTLAWECLAGVLCLVYSIHTNKFNPFSQ